MLHDRGRSVDSVRAQRQFVAAASHDLRTPIAAIGVELELADRPEAEAPELRAAIQAVRADVVSLGQLTDDLLDLAAADTDGRALSVSVTALAALVDSVIGRIRPLADRRGVGITAVIPDISIRVDRVRIERALGNVVANAVVHGGAGGSVEIVAVIEPLGSSIAIEVLDRGPGIPEGDRMRVLEPFERGAAASGRGSGLGLSMARAAVAAHGGTLDVRGREGGGARVVLRLPVAAAPSDASDADPRDPLGTRL